MITNRLDIKFNGITYETWYRDGELELRMCNDDRVKMFNNNPLLPENDIYENVIRQLERGFKKQSNLPYSLHA